MFTGIIEEVGTVTELVRRTGSARLSISCRTAIQSARVGDSIAVNGCCLTATELTDGGFSADLMGETLERTALGSLRPGATVNLERALPTDGRLGGHLVQGHVDAVARVFAVEPHDDWTTMRFSLPAEVAPYVVEKGSIAVDGTSLTVMEVTEDAFAVGLIPHTLAATALAARQVGDQVNIEADIVAKYVQRLLGAGSPTPYAMGDPSRTMGEDPSRTMGEDPSRTMGEDPRRTT